MDDSSVDNCDTLAQTTTVLAVQQLEDLLTHQLQKNVQPTDKANIGIYDMRQTAQKLSSPKLSHISTQQ